MWQYTQEWINAIYGSPEAAATAGYVPSTVRAAVRRRCMHTCASAIRVRPNAPAASH